MPANQNNWEGNHRWIGMWNSWSLILQCVYDVSLWMMMCSEEKGNCPFQHLCTAVWNAYDNVILKSCGLLGRVGIRGAQTIFNPNLDEDSCMMYSEKKNKTKKKQKISSIWPNTKFFPPSTSVNQFLTFLCVIWVDGNTRSHRSFG